MARPSREKDKSKEQAEMNGEKPKMAQSTSLTISEFEGAFHDGDRAFVYNWIDDEHGDSWLDQDVKDMEWLADQLYQDANEEPIE